MVKKLFEYFLEKICKKQIKKSLELKKYSRKKMINYKLYVKWKDYDNLINSWIDKAYFPKPKFVGASAKVELDLPNYETEADLKNAAGVDTSDFAKKNWFS